MVVVTGLPIVLMTSSPLIVVVVDVVVASGECDQGSHCRYPAKSLLAEVTGALLVGSCSLSCLSQFDGDRPRQPLLNTTRPTRRAPLADVRCQ